MLEMQEFKSHLNWISPPFWLSPGYQYIQIESQSKFQHQMNHSLTHFPQTSKEQEKEQTKTESSSPTNCRSCPKSLEDVQLDTIRKNIIISDEPLRQKYRQLLTPQYMKIEFSTQQKTLIRIQKVLDDHLFYLQNYRGKKKGEFFKSIRTSLIEAAHIFIEIDHIKQLLFIDQNLYIWEWEKDLGSNFDLLINIPPKSDTSSRKIMFAKKVYEFIKDKDKSASNVSLVRIPKMTVQFQQKQKLSAKKYELVMPTKDFKPKLKQTQINPFDIFKNNDDFKEKLYRGIKEKQQLQKKQKDSTGKINVTKKQILKVLDEVYLAFASSKVQNIFKVSLIQKVNRKLKMRDQIILQAVQIIEQKYPKYLKKINHQKGQILQIDKKEYSQIREELTLNQNKSTQSY